MGVDLNAAENTDPIGILFLNKIYMIVISADRNGIVLVRNGAFVTL